MYNSICTDFKIIIITVISVFNLFIHGIHVLYNHVNVNCMLQIVHSIITIIIDRDYKSHNKNVV